MATRHVMEAAFEGDLSVAADGNGYSDCGRKSSGKEARPGITTILAIGTAVPGSSWTQDEALGRFLRHTGMESNTELVERVLRLGSISGVKRRYFTFQGDELIAAHPEVVRPELPSIKQRLQFSNDAVTKMVVEASGNAIREWGRPVSDITHVVYVSSSEFRMPGGDLILSQALGLNKDVKRVLLYHLGCYAGAAGIRVAKDLAENNPGSRVLLTTADTVVPGYRVPVTGRPGDLVAAALFGDGSSATILGTDPIPTIERPWFEIDWTGQSFVPNTEKIINGVLTETGIYIDLGKELPQVIQENVREFCDSILKKTGKTSYSYSDLFYAVHPGGPAILNCIESELEIGPEKLASSRQILQDYGNMNCNTLIYILDHIRKTSSSKRKLTGATDDPEWGLILAFGPGVTLEGALARNLA